VGRTHCGIHKILGAGRVRDPMELKGYAGVSPPRVRRDMGTSGRNRLGAHHPRTALPDSSDSLGFFIKQSNVL